MNLTGLCGNLTKATGLLTSKARPHKEIGDKIGVHEYTEFQTTQLSVPFSPFPNTSLSFIQTLGRTDFHIQFGIGKRNYYRKKKKSPVKERRSKGFF